MPLSNLRTYALSLPDTSEEAHFEKIAFKVTKKIFVTVDNKKEEACVKLSLADQDIFCLGNKNTVYPVPNKWGLQGWTYINLKNVHPQLLRDAILLAYCEVAPKKLSQIIKSSLDAKTNL